MNTDAKQILKVLAENYMNVEGEMTFAQWLECELENYPESFDCFYERSWDEISDDDREERSEELREIGRETEESRDAACRELLEAKLVGCCGVGRHLIIWNSEQCCYEYQHDSARQRIGVDESEIKFACECSTEDCFDEAVEFVSYDEETRKWEAVGGTLYDSVTESGEEWNDYVERMMPFRKEICEAYAADARANDEFASDEIGWK